MTTTTLAQATDPRALRPVIHLIHDCFFDVQAVRFDKTQGTVEVPIWRKRAAAAPLLGRVVNWFRGRYSEEPVALLRFRKVNSCLLTDEQGIGSYDVNTIAFREQTKKVIIRTGIPTTFELDVDELDVMVENVGRTL